MSKVANYGLIILTQGFMVLQLHGTGKRALFYGVAATGRQKNRQSFTVLQLHERGKG